MLPSLPCKNFGGHVFLYVCIIYGSKESPEHGFLRDKLLKNFKDLKCYRSLINIFMCKNMLIINNNNNNNKRNLRAICLYYDLMLTRRAFSWWILYDQLKYFPSSKKKNIYFPYFSLIFFFFFFFCIIFEEVERSNVKNSTKCWEKEESYDWNGKKFPKRVGSLRH